MEGKSAPLSEEQQLRAVVVSTRQQLADPGVATILLQFFPIISGFDQAQSIAFGVMKQEFLAQGGHEHLMPLFEAKIKKALVGM